MTSPVFYRIAADIVLAVHWSFVLFVVVGLLLILVGGLRGWAWVRNPWFRVLHLLAIGIVVLQAWIGMVCPLTDLEMMLRQRAGDAIYGGSFIAHWLKEMLYFEFPPWVFALCYTAFGLVVLGSWILVRPRSFRKETRVNDTDDPAVNPS
ncbi:MAG: DUF2784 domain-containing protein [Pirellulaceae bacterium]